MEFEASKDEERRILHRERSGKFQFVFAACLAAAL